MAGKIQWQIEFAGLNEALSKLREIDRILSRISNHKGNIFTGEPSGNRPTSTSPNTRGASAATTAAAAAAGAYIASANTHQTPKQIGAGNAPSQVGGGNVPAQVGGGTGSLIPQILQHNQIIKGIGRLSTGKGHMAAMANQVMAVIQAGMHSPTGMGQSGGNAGGGSGGPTVINTRPIGGGGGGGGGGGVPPIIGGGGSGGGGGLGGLQGILRAGGMGGLATVVGAFAKFGPIVAGVVAAMLILKKAIELLIEGIKYAAEEYQKAAATGMDIRKSTAMTQAMKAVGVSGTPTYQMAGQTSAGGVISAARASGFGGAQQLQNMSKEFAAALKDGSAAARQMELSGKAGQLLSMDMIALNREWKTMLAQAAAALYPFLHGLMEMVKNTMKLINLYIEFWNRVKAFIGFMPTGEPGKARWASGGGGGGGMPAVTSWEKIGFKFGVMGGGPTQALQDIKGNTKESNKWLEMISEGIKLMLKINPSTAGAAQFLP